MLLSLWQKLFGSTLDDVRRENLDFLAGPDAARPDWRAMAVLLTTAVCLTVQNYADSPEGCARVVDVAAACGFDGVAADAARLIEWGKATRLNRLRWWAVVCIVTYVALPVVVTRLVLRKRLVEVGCSVRGALAGWPLYFLMAAVMGPIVWIVSADPSFLARYPFYKLLPGERPDADFFQWELLYAAQFAALEFFFRGFMVHGLKHRFGVYSIWVMTVPYCMIHFGKPMLESFAAIIAGVVLGLMSLKTRSIWLGAALHVSVAWSMDWAALWRSGNVGR